MLWLPWLRGVDVDVLGDQRADLLLADPAIGGLAQVERGRARVRGFRVGIDDHRLQANALA